MRYVFDVWNMLSKVADVVFVICIPWFSLPAKKPRRESWKAVIPAFLLMSLIAYGADYAFYPVPMWATVLLMLTIGVAFSALFCRGTLSVKTVLVCASVSTSILMHYLASYFLRPAGGSMFSMPLTMLAIALNIPPAVFFIRCAHIPSVNLPSRYGFGMSVFMVLLTLCMHVETMDWFQNIDQSFNIFFYLIVLGIILYVYYLFFSIIREYEQSNRYEVLARSMSDQNRHLREIRQMYEEQCMLRHEEKNQVLYMVTLLRQKRYDELDAYLSELYKKVAGRDLIWVGSDAINAVLSQKYSYAKSQNIPMHISIQMPKELTINESRLCAVIANLLDNALEASGSVPDPEIGFCVHPEGKYLHIMTRNRVNGDVMKENPNLMTTKLQGVHGLGLKLVRSVVREYDGMIEHHMEDDAFVLSLMLRMPE